MPYKFLQKLTNLDRSKHHKRLQSQRERSGRMWKRSSSISHPGQTISSTCGNTQHVFRLVSLPSVIVKGNLRLVWEENSQVALILLCTFRSTRCLLEHRSFSKLGRGAKHQRPPVKPVSWVFLFFSLSTRRMHRSTFHTSTALSLDKTNPQNCTCQLFRSKRRTTLIFFFFLDAWPFLKIIPSV